MRTKVILGGLIAFGCRARSSRGSGRRPGVRLRRPPRLQTGPATVAPHWSQEQVPRLASPKAPPTTSSRRATPSGTSRPRFLGNPYLWPQIWDQNKYITDAHWIYPGDPLILPKVALVAAGAGVPGAPGEEGMPEGAEGAPGEAGGPGGGPAAAALVPVTEEITLQCADYIVQDREDESLKIIGSEQGATKIAPRRARHPLPEQGEQRGRQGRATSTPSSTPPTTSSIPVTGQKLGTKIETTGWVRVILVQENTATAVVEQACCDIHAGDYLQALREGQRAPGRAPTSRRPPHPAQRQGSAGYVVDIARRRHHRRRGSSPDHRRSAPRAGSLPATSSPSTASTTRPSPPHATWWASWRSSPFGRRPPPPRSPTAPTPSWSGTRSSCARHARALAHEAWPLGPGLSHLSRASAAGPKPLASLQRPDRAPERVAPEAARSSRPRTRASGPPTIHRHDQRGQPQQRERPRQEQQEDRHHLRRPSCPCPGARPAIRIPRPAATLRRPVTASSRPRMIITIHAGTRVHLHQRRGTRPRSAACPRGGRGGCPSFVTWLRRRAK